MKEEITAEELFAIMVNNMTEEEFSGIIELCKKVSEKHLDKNDDLYQFFHNEELNDKIKSN